MVCLQRRIRQVVPVVLSFTFGFALQLHGQRFFADDPLTQIPEAGSAQHATLQAINPFYDFALNSVHYKSPAATASLGVNTLGEVPNSSWYTNRIGTVPMSIDELKHGARTHGVPQAPYTVISGKSEGVTPGFRIKDARGLTYFVKVDPPANPEMATAADVVGALFLYAVGYNVPENYILRGKRDEFHLSEKATFTADTGKKYPMTQGQLRQILDEIPVEPDGSIRVLASLSLPGKIIGPFRYQGTRTDDPNDLIPHQQRRDLRGLDVIFAWLNHTDAKGDNSMDVLVGKDKDARVLHNLLDFGDSFGSDSDIAKDPRHGQEFFLPTSKEQWHRAETLGLRPAAWEIVRYPHDVPAAGNFTAEAFDPLTWKPNYPNPAFLETQPDDAYWAAKKVMAFSNEDIRAIVEEGLFANPAATQILTDVLVKRRDLVGRAWFAKVLPIENLAIENGELHFVDLGAKYGFAPIPGVQFAWFEFDNGRQTESSMAGSTSALPMQLSKANEGDYIGCHLSAPSGDTRSVTGYFRREGEAWKLVGITRKSS